MAGIPCASNRFRSLISLAVRNRLRWALRWKRSRSRANTVAGTSSGGALSRCQNKSGIILCSSAILSKYSHPIPPRSSAPIWAVVSEFLRARAQRRSSFASGCPTVAVTNADFKLINYRHFRAGGRCGRARGRRSWQDRRRAETRKAQRCAPSVLADEATKAFATGIIDISRAARSAWLRRTVHRSPAYVAARDMDRPKRNSPPERPSHLAPYVSNSLAQAKRTRHQTPHSPFLEISKQLSPRLLRLPVAVLD